MNDLDDRLTDLLTRSAAAVEVRPDVDAVLGDDRDAAVVDLGRRPRDVRRLLALAATVLVVVGLGAAALVARPDDTRPLDVTDAPAAERRFPVFGDLPASLRDHRIEATDGAGTVHSFGDREDGDQLVRAALGKVADDGSVSDVIQLVASASTPEGPPGPPADEIEDLGGGYRLAVTVGQVEVYGPGTTVVAVGGPDTEDLIREIAGTSLTATTVVDGVPTLTLGDLPDGYTVTAPPTPADPEQAEAFVEGDYGVPTTVVETGVGSPDLAVISAGGSYVPVDIDGAPGVIAVRERRTIVAWTAPGGVHVRVASDLGEDDALLIARGIRLVDQAEWRRTYPERPEGEAPPIPAATTDHPLVGEPAPPVGGSTIGVAAYHPPQDAGEWTIVSFTATWCVPCVEMLDRLAPVHRDLHAAGRASVVSLFVDDTVAAAATVVEEHEVDWQVLVTRPSDVEPWGIDGTVPATAFVDPDGTVRGVVVGLMTGREIDQTLDALGG
ncbi:MAG TPA: TlpA disulfide reductase family protein [Iamia sp.]|jgi:hypothetical protein|nr:TlpA disulfide reductase family protein [Iamia sp.]